MEAATEAARRLEGDKARRIIAAMRASVGQRGAAASTFDHVAREAGVSRGLLHYYFGSKERLLVEVVRHDCDERNRAMDDRLAKAGTIDEIIEALVIGLEEFIEDDPGVQAVIYEMLSASRHSEEIRAELAELYRQWRDRLAGWLRKKEREGVVRLQAEPEAVASILFALGDGFGIQVLSDRPAPAGRDRVAPPPAGPPRAQPPKPPAQCDACGVPSIKEELLNHLRPQGWGLRMAGSSRHGSLELGPPLGPGRSACGRMDLRDVVAAARPLARART
jgi:AcrR family transcriptional regulator